ncbi:uncharacterized protein LACBIDRAFT_297697 [Laccaria bicolor S238N-H82]|uniref:Predicted protein n=1 Tax=Laccaria bicolor (strain S238N-H82 / ATCC MYA-4686) TaxID=486041 RepID=B0DBT3_LACBS|nr:uncharacterized protein LACBIDRAFT_297697 [Laccaria bicolor S238N-H82]EDR08235.1 predicted protein [Laccaria bicolor S238N-H82]|eukprot:XP_001881305.1 predicted protein [Laccaria bicolor S238N-H82]
MYSASTATFVTALVFNAAVFGIELVIFTLLRPYFKAIYEPLTYTPPPSKRAQPLSNSLLSWPIAVFKADYRGIIRANGLDAYFFVRFLRMMVKVLLPIWIISWIVLFPVTAVNSSVSGKDSLDKLSYGNVANDIQVRYAAHLILVYIFTFWIFYNIKNEMKHFLITRQQHLIETEHAKSVQANTILITGIPAKYLSQDALYKLYNGLPGGVKRIWINRNLKDLPDIYDRRLAACSKLESAETALLRTAAKLRLKDEKANGPKSEKSQEANIEEAPTAQAIEVPVGDRPQHRLGSIPFIGKKVDTIEWARQEIAECTRLLDEGRARIREADEAHAPHDDDDLFSASSVDDEGNPRVRQKKGEHGIKEIGHAVKGAGQTVKHTGEAVKGRVIGSGGAGEYPPMNSAFITFRKQISAHLAVQVLAHHEPYRMSDRYVEVSPEDVIWANLGMNPYEQKIRVAISYAATAALIIFWTIPVGFVAVISNIYTVCAKAVFLSWICKLPKVVVGIISGILPPVLLAVLMMLLPIILRLLARFEGIPKRTGLELSLMTRFFIFQVVHSFLVVTIGSGIVASLTGILNNPTSVPTILAQQLPQASTFFLTYIILQGLSGVAGGFLQIVPLLIYYVKLFILGSTPRSVYDIKYGARNVAWGTTFPGVTLLVVITLGYSIISPVINGLAFATFFLFYMLYKYIFLWVYQQDLKSDTGGLFFPKAIQHVFVGMYVQQLCLCALFFLAQDDKKKASAVPEGALMVVLIVITAGFNIIINQSYDRLLCALPLSLQDKTYTAQGDEGEEEHEGQEEPIPSRTPQELEAGGPQDHDKLAKQGLISESPAIEEKKRAELEKKIQTEEDYGFAHPAASRPQRTIWLPRDDHGLVTEEQRACAEAGVDVSDKNAQMDAKGKVDIVGGPPDLVGEI